MPICRMFFVATCCCLGLAATWDATALAQNSSDPQKNDASANPTGSESPPKATTLTVDYGDGFQKRFTGVVWRKGMTVLDVMSAAKRHQRGRLDFKHRGNAATALLTQIDDLINQGGGGRNWIFYVNKQKADRSFAIRELKPGDEVLWRFETYQ